MSMDFLLLFCSVLWLSQYFRDSDLADFVSKGTFCAECSRFLVRKRENKATNISGGRFRNRADLTT